VHARKPAAIQSLSYSSVHHLRRGLVRLLVRVENELARMGGVSARVRCVGAILGRQFGARGGYLKVIVFLIATHAAGYFLGGKVFYMARNPPEVSRDLAKGRYRDPRQTSLGSLLRSGIRGRHGLCLRSLSATHDGLNRLKNLGDAVV